MEEHAAARPFDDMHAAARPFDDMSVPIFDRGTGSKPERLRSGFLQADLSLIVQRDPAARVSA